MRRLIAWFYVIFNIHKINKEKKIEIYKECIEELEFYKLGYICSCLRMHSNTRKPLWSVFPEIYIQKPLINYKFGVFWFPTNDYESRIKIFKKAIQRLENK